MASEASAFVLRPDRLCVKVPRRLARTAWRRRNVSEKAELVFQRQPRPQEPEPPVARRAVERLMDRLGAWLP